MGDREATRALEALAAAYLAAFSSLQTAASFASARLVRQLLADGPSEQAMDRLAALWPGLLVPTQERVGRLAEAQLLRQAEVLEMLEAGEPLTGRARSIEPGLPATLVTAQTPSMRSPGLRMNRLLAAELEFSEALDAAGRYGENVAATALPRLGTCRSRRWVQAALEVEVAAALEAGHPSRRLRVVSTGRRQALLRCGWDGQPGLARVLSLLVAGGHLNRGQGVLPRVHRRGTQGRCSRAGEVIGYGS